MPTVVVPRIRLSRHFWLYEGVVTKQVRFAEAQLAYACRPEIRKRMVELGTTILDPIRDHVDRIIDTTSWVRCPELNAVTPGASSTSQHSKGEAADFVVPGWTDAQLRELWAWIAFESGLPFGQVIFEDKRPDRPNEGAWIHVSLGAPYRSPARCGMVMEWTPATGYVHRKAA